MKTYYIKSLNDWNMRLRFAYWGISCDWETGDVVIFFDERIKPV